MSTEEKDLTTHSAPSIKSQFIDIDDKPIETVCLLCDTTFTLPSNQQEFLSHLFNVHRLVIGDVEQIASLKSYIRYWRVKFKEEPLTTYCTTFTENKKNSELLDDKPNENEFYFLLTDCIMEDKTLRDEIRRAKLDWVLEEQLKERNDKTFKRGCMFCRTEFTGRRVEYLNHLSNKHNIFLGKPENIVFVDEYLDKIQNNIENFICLYCEKHFKNRLVLKEHMRKKLHKQVNPNNREYDKYYIANYMLDRFSKKKDNPHSTKQTIENKRSAEVMEGSKDCSDNEDDNWSDWETKNIPVINCLFCNQSSQSFHEILQHMTISHLFNFEHVTRDLTFYQKVKIVNYIRKQMDSKRCIYCDGNLENDPNHLDKLKHYKIPSKQIWDQPEFYFPMFDSDSFLYHLDNDWSSSEEEANELVEK